MKDRTTARHPLPEPTGTVFVPVTAFTFNKRQGGAPLLEGGPPFEDLLPKVLGQLTAFPRRERFCHGWRFHWHGCLGPLKVGLPGLAGQLGQLHLDLVRPLPLPALGFLPLPLFRFLISGRDNLGVLLVVGGLAAGLFRRECASFLAATVALHFGGARLANALMVFHINYNSLNCKLTPLWKLKCYH